MEVVWSDCLPEKMAFRGDPSYPSSLFIGLCTSLVEVLAVPNEFEWWPLGQKLLGQPCVCPRRSLPAPSLGHSLDSTSYPVLGLLVLHVLSAIEDRGCVWDLPWVCLMR